MDNNRLTLKDKGLLLSVAAAISSTEPKETHPCDNHEIVLGDDNTAEIVVPKGCKMSLTFN